MVETIQADIDYCSDPGLINRQNRIDHIAGSHPCMTWINKLFTN